MAGRRAFVALWLLASLAAAVPGKDGDFLKRVRARILESQPFRAEFVQQVYVDGDLTLEESGIVVFAGRDRVKWEYRDPEFKVFLLEKDRYRFYDREGGQMLIGRLGREQERLVWELLLSERPGDAGAWDEARRRVTLRLEGENGPQELKVLLGPDLLPARVEQSGEGEVTTVYLFRNYRTRIALAADEFELDLPAGVEVIEERGP